MQNLAKEPLKIVKIDRIRILGIELELACTRGSISSLRSWRFCSHEVKSFGGGATTTSGLAASSRFRSIPLAASPPRLRDQTCATKDLRDQNRQLRRLLDERRNLFIYRYTF